MREALEKIASEDIPANIVDVMEPKERRMVEWAQEALSYRGGD